MRKSFHPELNKTKKQSGVSRGDKTPIAIVGLPGSSSFHHTSRAGKMAHLRGLKLIFDFFDARRRRLASTA
jgi:hypothetical protein